MKRAAIIAVMFLAGVVLSVDAGPFQRWHQRKADRHQRIADRKADRQGARQSRRAGSYGSSGGYGASGYSMTMQVRETARSFGPVQFVPIVPVQAPARE